MPHLHWLLPGPFTSPAQLDQASLASTRLRAAVALPALHALGWVVSCGENVAEQADKLVVGKIGGDQIQGRTAEWISQIELAKSRKALVFLDYTDHHLGYESAMSPFYRAVLGLVDVCICPSVTMKALLQQYWRGPIKVMEDALEVAPRQPKQVVGSPVTALWFGHASNIGYLKQFLESSFRPTQRVRIIALTNEAGATWFLKAATRVPVNVRVEIGIWSMANMLAAAAVSDICLIPSDQTDIRKSGVSSNRLITALALGLPTAADRLSAYAEFSDYFVDIRAERFHSLIDDPLAYREKVVQAQQQVVPRFSRQALGQQWGELFND